ncbi:uncharacterized protein PB18E9.04c-like isoform X2 [Pygocentrus nattereri]|uniref:uncharacterized protein PB18E9.04c-like isoform X2 n=1 Tax=Pygocentrus nattereri TaxID=42514 RepID=UPI001891E0FC|nr:uncharacterized protein PB18E9.04c-like isoform X2 [Pygocentrus nattereri]
MYIILLFIYLGGTTLPFVKCFSDGNFDGYQDVCQSMAVDHDGQPNQNPASNPFTVVPDYVDVTVLPTVVTANSASQPFRGFMLEARETNDGPPVGVFSLLDSSISRLQSCNGAAGSAVTQIDNQDKTAVTVSWSAPNTGRYYFRATFVENFDIFWLRKDISPPTTTTTPFTTTSTSSTPFTTTSTSSTPFTTMSTSSTPFTTTPTSSTPFTTTSTSSTPFTTTPTSSTPFTTTPTSSTPFTTTSTFSTPFTTTSTSALTTVTSVPISTPQPDPTTVTEVTSATSVRASTLAISSTDTTVASTHALHSASTLLSGPTTITEVKSLVPTSTTDPTTSSASLGMSTKGFSSIDTTVTSTHALHSASTQLSHPTTITEVTTLVLTSTAVPSTYTDTTSAKSDLSVCKPGSDWSLVLLLATYLSLVEGFPFLMKHRKQRNVVVMQVSSVLSLLFSLVAFIISLILTELVAAKVLTGLAVFLSLCQVIVIFSFCGPSHELRRPLCWAFGLLAFANICLTTAAIFVGFVKCKICLWLLIVMAAYLAFDLLFYMLCLIFTFKKPGQISQRISFRSVCLVILTLGNIAFTVALTTGIFLCNYGTITT